MTYQVRVRGLEGTQTLTVEGGVTLYTAMVEHGLPLSAPCGGKCLCGQCRVRVQGAGLQPPGAEERQLLGERDLHNGIRLACAVVVQGDLEVSYEEQTRGAVIQTGGLSHGVQPQGTPSWKAAALPTASLEDPRSDWEKLQDALPETSSITLAALRDLSAAVRVGGQTVHALVDGGRVLRVQAETPQAPLGVAVDIGTTTVVAYLMDLATGEELAVASMLNPQKSYGDDVITRMDYARQEAAQLETLRDKVVSGINGLLKEVCAQVQRPTEDVCRMAVAGNTVMLHLFAGVDPRNIAVVPFTPGFVQAQSWQARDLGLHLLPEGQVDLAPGVASYVGGDIVAGVLSSGLAQSQALSLLVDIGTNGEMVLGNQRRMLACATAAGPALEGAHIRCGLGGVAGAISQVRLGPEGIQATTIGGAPARGICGSGLVDAIAMLLEAGVVDETGYLDSEAGGVLAGRLYEGEQGGGVRLQTQQEGAARDIVLEQGDVREVQLAKAAIAAGMKVLLAEWGAPATAVERVYIAGGFGSFIDKDHACDIGLLLPEFRGKIVPIGNGAGAGAVEMLLREDLRRQAEDIAGRIEYVELSTRKDFQDQFMEQMFFGA